jgi:hypothetical protein
MTTSVSFRPQVTLAKSVVNQAKANYCKEGLNNVEKAVQNNKLTDISAMTQRMQLESQLNETKVAPVKFVEEIKPQPLQTAKVADVGGIKNVTDVIKNFHKGKVASKADQAQVLTNQMNMIAASNMILHGLFYDRHRKHEKRGM